MLTINRQATEQIYQQLYRQIRAEIETGVRQPDQKMPSTRYLAQQLAVSRNTVDHAYQELVAEGYLLNRPGAAYRVTTKLPFVVKTPELPVHQTAAFQYDFTENYDYLRLFPKQAWQAAEQRVFWRGIEHIQPANGDLAYRQQLVHYLARLKQIQVGADQIVITSGFNEAAGIMASLVPEFSQQGLAVLEPSAPNAQSVWQTLGVPTTLFHRGDALPTAGGYVLTPTHNFPDSAGFTAKERQALADNLQQRYLIELDTDGNLVYTGQPAPALFHTLNGQRCFYYTNFDEILGSCLCMGILVIPAALVPVYQQLYGKLANRNSQIQQQILSQLIANDDLERFMRQLTIVYANRRQLLQTQIQQAFGNQLTAMGVAAGSFMTFRVQLSQPVKTLIAQAAEVGVGLVDPDRCWHDGQPLYPSVIFSLRQADDAQIIGAVKALATAWQHN